MRYRRARNAALLLGVGLGGFLDGIVLHQIAHWHQMLSARVPPASIEAMKQNMAADGFADAISPEALTTLSPYQTEHINRFGDYVLDLSSTPAPLPFILPERRSPWRQTAAADV